MTTTKLNDGTKEFTCHVNARPSPTITWYHNDVMLSNDGVAYTIAENTSTSTCDSTTLESKLNILGINISDAGSVKCSAAVQTDKIIFLNQTTNVVVECKYTEHDVMLA